MVEQATRQIAYTTVMTMTNILEAALLSRGRGPDDHHARSVVHSCRMGSAAATRFT
jgi:hypothetical protein